MALQWGVGRRSWGGGGGGYGATEQKLWGVQEAGRMIRSRLNQKCEGSSLYLYGHGWCGGVINSFLWHFVSSWNMCMKNISYWSFQCALCNNNKMCCAATPKGVREGFPHILFLFGIYIKVLPNFICKVQ